MIWRLSKLSTFSYCQNGENQEFFCYSYFPWNQFLQKSWLTKMVIWITFNGSDFWILRKKAISKGRNLVKPKFRATENVQTKWHFVKPYLPKNWFHVKYEL